MLKILPITTPAKYDALLLVSGATPYCRLPNNTPTMKEELEKAEAERGLLRTEIEVCSRQMQKVGAILPGAKEKFKIMLADLQTALKREIPKARTIVKQILGETIMINVVENRRLQAELSPNLLEILGFSTHSRIGLVAGAGFEPAAFRL